MVSRRSLLLFMGFMLEKARQVLKVVREGLLCGLLALLCWVVWQAVGLIGKTTEAVGELHSIAQDARKEMNVLSVKVNAAADKVSAYGDEQLAFLRSPETRKNIALGGRALRNLDELMIRAQVTVSDLHKSINRLDANINGEKGVVPQVKEFVANLDERINKEAIPAVTEAVVTSQGLAEEIRVQVAGIGQVAKTSALLVETTLAETQDFVKELRPEVQGTVENANKMMKSAAEATENVNIWTKRLARPVHAVKDFFLQILPNVVGRIIKP